MACGCVRAVACGGLFKPLQSSTPARPIEEVVNMTLMPDAIHPSPYGTVLLAKCFENALATWRNERKASREQHQQHTHGQMTSTDLHEL